MTKDPAAEWQAGYEAGVEAAAKALTFTVLSAPYGKTMHKFKIDPTKKTIVRPEHSLFGYAFEPEVVEYGRIHTDGSRSGGQPVVDNAMFEALQKDAGIPHLPTQETYQFRLAVSGEGPLAYQWSDKPHRLLYDACSIIESEAALRQPTQADTDAMESILWVDTIIDDKEAIAKAFARHRNAAIEECAKALEADAKLCDCAALEANECACGAWDDYKSITSARAVEIVRKLADSQ